MQHRVPQLVRRAVLAAALVTPLALAGVLVRAQDKKPDAKVPSKTFYKNIKVLKDLPSDQLIPYMHGYNTALGVKCDFCHVDREFAKDDKPMKNKAREMIVLVKDLNGKYKTVDKKATCAMCHHGQSEPQTTMP